MSWTQHAGLYCWTKGYYEVGTYTGANGVRYLGWYVKDRRQPVACGPMTADVEQAKRDCDAHEAAQALQQQAVAA